LFNWRARVFRYWGDLSVDGLVAIVVRRTLFFRRFGTRQNGLIVLNFIHMFRWILPGAVFVRGVLFPSLRADFLLVRRAGNRAVRTALRRETFFKTRSCMSRDRSDLFAGSQIILEINDLAAIVIGAN